MLDATRLFAVVSQRAPPRLGSAVLDALMIDLSCRLDLVSRTEAHVVECVFPFIAEDIELSLPFSVYLMRALARFFYAFIFLLLFLLLPLRVRSVAYDMGLSTTPEHRTLDAECVLHVLRDCGPCVSVSCLPTAAVSSPLLLPAGRPCPWSTATHDARHPPHAQRACRPCLNQLVARHEDFRPSTTPTSYLHWCPQHLKLASPIVYVGLGASPHTATDFSSMRRLSVYHPRKNKLHPPKPSSPDGAVVLISYPFTAILSYLRPSRSMLNACASFTGTSVRPAWAALVGAIHHHRCRVLEPDACHDLPYIGMRTAVRIPNKRCTTTGMPLILDGCFSFASLRTAARFCGIAVSPLAHASSTLPSPSLHGRSPSPASPPRAL
ncbi:hypothetical protein B0H13DRAFT_2315878 [Mycena leptocephala]|nr:hypothetical protein B0H13DRAFT_2315878 [Mycena leptocephala]